MTGKRLFVGKKKCEDRFTIITDYDGEIGVKENRSGDVLVLKHSDLNAQQFVAQLVVFLNDQNQAIVDLYDGSKYWSDKATEKIKELEEENKELKEDNDIKFWKHELMVQWNKTQIISHELSLAIENGYEISEDFKKYLDELKERHEENMKKAERLKI